MIIKKYLSVQSAASLIDVSPWTIRKWIKLKRIPVYKFGGAVRIKESDLLNFAELTQSREMMQTRLLVDKK